MIRSQDIADQETSHVQTVIGNFTPGIVNSSIYANANAASFTVTLPDASGYKGKKFIIKKTDSSANTVTIATTNSQTIDGASTQVLTGQYGILTVQSDGSNWNIIAANTAGFSGQVSSHIPVAVNATATLTAAQVATGYITSTSAAAVTMTLPTGTLLGAAIGAVQGTILDLYIDNTAGANTVTIAVATNGILSALAAAVGTDPGLLTVPSGVTGQACFRLMFSSATAYTFTRIA